MLLAYIFKFKSLWHKSFPKILSPCGGYIVEDFWISKKGNDYLQYMIMESYQFMFHGSFLLICIFHMIGYSFNDIMEMSMQDDI